MRKYLLTSACVAAISLGAIPAMAYDDDAQNAWGHPAKYKVPEAGPHKSIDQGVFENEQYDPGTDRINLIGDELGESEGPGAFNDGAAGIIHVQQNNGHSNAIGADANVLVNASGGGDDIQQSNNTRQTVEGNTLDDYVETEEVHSHFHPRAPFRIYVDEAVNPDARRDNTINNSFNGALGIVAVQQNNGDGNAMGISDVVSANINGTFGPVSGVGGGSTDDSRSKTFSQALVVGNETTDIDAEEDIPHYYYVDNDLDDLAGERFNLVTDSFVGAMGIISVQQNNGNANAMSVANTVVADLGTDAEPYKEERAYSVVVTEAGVGGNRSYNNSTPELQNADGQLGGRSNTVTGDSFSGAAGILTAQQNNGDNNAIQSATGVRAAIDTDDDIDEINSFTGAFATVVENQAGDVWSNRDNTLSGNAFAGSMGIINVQQNNGDANAMQISNNVTAVTGDGEAGEPGYDGGVRYKWVWIPRYGWKLIKHDPTDENSIVVDTWADVVGNTTFDFNSNPRGGGNELVGERTNFIGDGAFTGEVQGIFSVQQNNGNANAMQVANSVAVNDGAGILDHSDDDIKTFNVSAGANVSENYTAALSDAGPTVNEVGSNDRDNLLTGEAFADGAGIANVQQNNGDANAIQAANGVFAVFDGDDIEDIGGHYSGGLNVSAYADVSGNSTVTEFRLAGDDDTNRVNTQNDGVFSGYQGIANVQQNNGDGNAMQIANGVYALMTTADLAEYDDADDAMAGAFATAFVTENFAIMTNDADRVNTITGGSFSGAMGIANVQQNNGDHNAIQSSNAVIVHDDDDGSGFNGAVMADAGLLAVVSGNSTALEPTRALPGQLNVIDGGSFNGFKGIATVQQNNGNGNAIQSSVTVIASY